MDVYCKRYPEDEIKNQRIYDILEQIGYNKLSIYDYLKHISDKRGAHIDVGHSLVVELVNYAAVYGIQRSPFCFRTAVFRSQRPPIC